MDRSTLAAGVLALTGVAVAAYGRHGAPPRYRAFGGPSAIWNIPDGQALGPALPRRLRIPRAGVNAAILRTRRDRDGGIAVPDAAHAKDAAWYAGSVRPGTRGPSIIVGHYDDDRGGAVFYRAPRLRKNDEIQVERSDGSVAVFTVDALEQVRKSLFPARRVLAPVHYAGLRLITCGGRFDQRTGHYRDNVIIYAHLIRAKAPRRAGR